MPVKSPKLTQFYLDKEDKEQFMINCYLLDTSMSRELRSFVKRFNLEAETKGIKKLTYKAYRLSD